MAAGLADELDETVLRGKVECFGQFVAAAGELDDDRFGRFCGVQFSGLAEGCTQSRERALITGGVRTGGGARPGVKTARVDEDAVRGGVGPG